MSFLRLALIATLALAGISGRVLAADFATDSSGSVLAPREPMPEHQVVLQEGLSQNYITVYDLPGATVRVWMRIPDGSMAFVGGAVVMPSGFVTLAVPKAVRIPGQPRYLVVTSKPGTDIRDWLE